MSSVYPEAARSNRWDNAVKAAQNHIQEVANAVLEFVREHVQCFDLATMKVGNKTSPAFRLSREVFLEVVSEGETKHAVLHEHIGGGGGAKDSYAIVRRMDLFAPNAKAQQERILDILYRHKCPARGEKAQDLYLADKIRTARDGA